MLVSTVALWIALLRFTVAGAASGSQAANLLTELPVSPLREPNERLQGHLRRGGLYERLAPFGIRVRKDGAQAEGSSGSRRALPSSTDAGCGRWMPFLTATTSAMIDKAISAGVLLPM